MALDKAGLQAALLSIFEDLSAGKTADMAAEEMADAIDDYVKTAIATVVIPPGTVVTAATAAVLNPTPILLTGGPATTPPGGLS